ncbi:MAG: carboxyltransferase domain-containing protein [Labilithrix sp.]|nr:carboxyltransferase domain-containing protein [Labilithrix sp.]
MTPFGDRAVRFAVAEGAPRRRLVAELSALPGVRDVVLAEEIGCVVFDDDVGDRAAVTAGVTAALATGRGAADDEPGAIHVVRVVYDGEDLDAVARAIGRSRQDVVALHAGAEYEVAMLGFMPGFAYLRGLPDVLRLPRRAPRTRVPAGSVAIAADYTGIYPFASPGGWHLLGRALGFQPFGAGSDARAALAIGDVVRFAPAAEDDEPPRRDGPRAAAAPPASRGEATPHLEITRASGFAILVDAGRPGRMRDAVPPGGPLVCSRFARANASAGNAPGACAIEVSGTLEVTAHGGRVTIADDVAGARTLAEGERHVVATEGRTRVRYLALAGGIDAPVILGGRGALLVAGIGGLLRRGDRLAPRAHDGASSVDAAGALGGGDAPDTDAPIALMPGPDADALPPDALTKTLFRVAAASDRTGTRLERLAAGADHAAGGGVAAGAAHARRSTPMVSGAIELTPSGLIVLGPDHPTTGGYPVVAVVRSSSLDRLFAKPLRATVRLEFS